MLINVLVLALLGFGAMAGFAQSVPLLINYQGKLTDAAGSPLADGLYRVAFRLWDQRSHNGESQKLVWGRIYDVTLVGGTFNVILGNDGGLPVDGAAVNDIGFAFTEKERYLGLTILSRPGLVATLPVQEIVPRQQILSTPFALHSANGCPPGTIVAFGGASAPSGWMLCDGRSVSRADYSELFKAIGIIYGPGDGTSTFNLPRLAGRVPVGRDAEQVEFEDIGKSGGSKTHKLTVDEMPQHSHQTRAKTGAVVAHRDADSFHIGGSTWSRDGAADENDAGIRPTGGGLPHNILQPYLVISYIIKL